MGGKPRSKMHLEKTLEGKGWLTRRETTIEKIAEMSSLDLPDPAQWMWEHKSDCDGNPRHVKVTIVITVEEID